MVIFNKFKFSSIFILSPLWGIIAIQFKFFGLSIPDYVKGVNKKILNPINAWKNKELYSKQAVNLSAQFKENFKIYGKKVEYLINSGPLV